jgi:hypothetical protein
MLFWDISCSLVEGTTVSEQPAAFIFRIDILQVKAVYFLKYSYSSTNVM